MENHSVYRTTLADGEQVTTLIPHGSDSPDMGAELTELFGPGWRSEDAGRVTVDVLRAAPRHTVSTRPSSVATAPRRPTREAMVAFIADAIGGDDRAFAEAGKAVAMATEHPLIEINIDSGGATVILSLGTGSIAQPSPQMQIAHLTRRARTLQDRRRSIEKRAGRALREPDAVQADQNDAIDFFAAGNFSENSNDEIAAAGRRIARLSDMLVAADLHRDAVRREQEAKDRLAEMRERFGVDSIRPVAGRRS